MAGVTCVVSSIVTKLSLMSGHCVSLNMRDVTPVGDKEEKICCLLSFINLLQPSLEGDFKKVLFCFYYMNSNYTTNVNNFAVICLKIFLRLLYFGSIIFKNLSKLKIDVLHSYLQSLFGFSHQIFICICTSNIIKKINNNAFFMFLMMP